MTHRIKAGKIVRSGPLPEEVLLGGLKLEGDVQRKLRPNNEQRHFTKKSINDLNILTTHCTLLQKSYFDQQGRTRISSSQDDYNFLQEKYRTWTSDDHYKSTQIPLLDQYKTYQTITARKVLFLARCPSLRPPGCV